MIDADVLVAFLGAPQNGYRESSYIWQGKTYQSRYSPEALVHFFRPGRMVLMVTQTAALAQTEGHNNLKHLTKCVETVGCAVYPVPIPEDGSELALWETFDACVAAIREN